MNYTGVREDKFYYYLFHIKHVFFFKNKLNYTVISELSSYKADQQKECHKEETRSERGSVV